MRLRELPIVALPAAGERLQFLETNLVNVSDGVEQRFSLLPKLAAHRIPMEPRQLDTSSIRFSWNSASVFPATTLAMAPFILGP